MPPRSGPRTLLTLTLLVACNGETPPAPMKAAPTKAEPAKAEPAPTPEPGVQEDGSVVSAVDWFEGTFEEALALAKKENKLVFMDVGAYWCPPCHELDEKTFVDPAVGEALGRGFVALHVDAEKGEGPELVERYHIQAYPTLVVLEPSGVEKGRLVDFLPPPGLLSALETLRSGGNVLAALEEEVENHPDDLEKLYALGNAHALAAHRDEAEKAFDQVLLGDPRNEMGLAVRVLYDRAQFLTEKMDRDYEKAIAQYRELQKKFPDTSQALRAHRKIARALHRLEREQEAIASVHEMVKADPGDVDMYANVGWFCFRNRVGAAEGLATVEKGLGIEPDNAELHYLAAELHALQGHPAEALEAMRKASMAEPKSNYYKRQVRRFEAALARGEAG